MNGIERNQKESEYECHGLVSTIDEALHNLLVNASYIGAMLFLMVGLGCFVYSWFVLLKRSADPSFSWRERVSLLAMILASLAAALRFVMPAFMPRADWGTGVGVAAQAHVVAVWTKIGVEAACVALLLALVGRPRLIAPIATAAMSIAFFWILSTIP